ncbi:hypothetical protein [Bosea sp. 124]|uniref:hypothetical protein n=1 Tax=Bosea sp. 124 TaxID=2135642 RepID=UPI0020C104B0|nr:hypothetical protein [Bosea sp. 124]
MRVLDLGEVCEAVQSLGPQRAHGLDGMKDAIVDRGQRVALLDRRQMRAEVAQQASSIA